MLSMILTYLPILGIAVVINIILGTYYNININFQHFDWKKMLIGIIKGVIVATAFVGLAYCFDATETVIDIGTFELTPTMIMQTSIAIYMVKDVTALANILKVKKSSDTNLISKDKDTSKDVEKVVDEQSDKVVDNSIQLDPLDKEE